MEQIWKGYQTANGGFIPAVYSEFFDVFSKPNAETLAPHYSIDHAIALEPGFKLPCGRIYTLLEFELRMLKAYIETNLAKGFNQRSSSGVAAPILLAKKQDGGLWLCVEYWALNVGTIKIRYPLPLILKMLDRLRGAWIFTKLHFRNAYHPIRNEDGEEFKTTLRTRYDQFQCRVLPFSVANAAATFQAYIDDCLRPYIDDFAIGYLWNILI